MEIWIIEERSLSRRGIRIGIIGIIEIIERKRIIMDSSRLNLLNISLNMKRNRNINKKSNIQRNITLKIDKNLKNMHQSMSKRKNKLVKKRVFFLLLTQNILKRIQLHKSQSKRFNKNQPKKDNKRNNKRINKQSKVLLSLKNKVKMTSHHLNFIQRILLKIQDFEMSLMGRQL